MGLYCVHDLRQAVDGELTLAPMPPRDGAFAIVGRSVCRSAEVSPGDLYWHFDSPACGPDSVEEACARGALGIVSSRAATPWAGMFALRARDVSLAAARTAGMARERFPGVVVAVGGPAGKTVVRRLIDTVLRDAYRGCDADDFSPLETPARSGDSVQATCELRRFWMTIASLPLSAEYAALELHAELLVGWAERVRLANPRALVLTGWPVDGDDDSNWLETLADDSWLIAQGDDPRLRRALAGRKHVVWFGRGGDNDLVAENVRQEADALALQVGARTLRLPAHGRQHVDAALAAFAVGRLFERSPCEIGEAMAGFQPPPRRCEIVRAGGCTLVSDESRWAPASLSASFDAARELAAPGRRIVVLGGFGNPTNRVDDLRAEAGRAAVTRCGADVLVACGAGGETVREAAVAAGMPCGRAFAVADSTQAIDVIRGCVRPGDVVLVKGAPSDGIAALLGALTPVG